MRKRNDVEISLLNCFPTQVAGHSDTLGNIKQSKAQIPQMFMKITDEDLPMTNGNGKSKGGFVLRKSRERNDAHSTNVSLLDQSTRIGTTALIDTTFLTTTNENATKHRRSSINQFSMFEMANSTSSFSISPQVPYITIPDVEVECSSAAKVKVYEEVPLKPREIKQVSDEDVEFYSQYYKKNLWRVNYSMDIGGSFDDQAFEEDDAFNVTLQQAIHRFNVESERDKAMQKCQELKEWCDQSAQEAQQREYEELDERLDQRYQVDHSVFFIDGTITEDQSFYQQDSDQQDENNQNILN